MFWTFLSFNLNQSKHKKMFRTLFWTLNVLRCGWGFIFIIFHWLKLLHKWNTSSQQGPRFAAFFKNFGIQLLYVWCLSFCGQIFLKALNLGAYCHRIHSQKTFLWQFRDMAMKRKFTDFFFFFILLLENIYFDTHDADSPDFFKNVSTFNSDLLWTW